MAKIHIEDADCEGRQRGKKSADGGARNGIALCERAEADGVSGTSQRNPVLGKFQKIPRNVFGDPIFGLAFGIYFDFYSSGGMRKIALNAIDVQAAGLEMPKRFLAETIIADAAGDDAGIAEQRGDVREICGSAAELFTAGEKIPEEFAEADDDGARGGHSWLKKKAGPDRVGTATKTKASEVVMEFAWDWRIEAVRLV